MRLLGEWLLGCLGGGTWDMGHGTWEVGHGTWEVTLVVISVET
jgi:hypothetical protein